MKEKRDLFKNAKKLFIVCRLGREHLMLDESIQNAFGN